MLVDGVALCLHGQLTPVAPEDAQVLCTLTPKRDKNRTPALVWYALEAIDLKAKMS
jgi:hypothetical protein